MPLAPGDLSTTFLRPRVLTRHESWVKDLWVLIPKPDSQIFDEPVKVLHRRPVDLLKPFIRQLEKRLVSGIVPEFTEPVKEPKESFIQNPHLIQQNKFSTMGEPTRVADYLRSVLRMLFDEFIDHELDKAMRDQN